MAMALLHDVPTYNLVRHASAAVRLPRRQRRSQPTDVAISAAGAMAHGTTATAARLQLHTTRNHPKTQRIGKPCQNLTVAKGSAFSGAATAFWTALSYRFLAAMTLVFFACSVVFLAAMRSLAFLAVSSSLALAFLAASRSLALAFLAASSSLASFSFCFCLSAASKP